MQENIYNFTLKFFVGLVQWTLRGTVKLLPSTIKTSHDQNCYHMVLAWMKTKGSDNLVALTSTVLPTKSDSDICFVYKDVLGTYNR